jgi:hypothetical protein
MDAPPRARVRLSDRARGELRPGEALVFDWHRVAICCAAAGDTSLRRTTMREVERSGAFVELSDDPSVPVYAHRRVAPHLAGQQVDIDCHRRLGVRSFTSSLPCDFGLRASLGRLPG